MSANQGQITQKRGRRSGWKICADAASEMGAILDELEEYSGVYEEAAALRKQLKRIERVCAQHPAAERDAAEPAEPEKPDEPGGTDKAAPSILSDSDPRAAAQSLIAQLPLREIFRNKALADVFLSELLLTLARESSFENRKELQRKGIAEAKAQGVRFGKPAKPLPENFEEVHRAWRKGQLSMKEASELCGMPRTTFYNAAQRMEKSETA